MQYQEQSILGERRKELRRFESTGGRASWWDSNVEAGADNVIFHEGTEYKGETRVYLCTIVYFERQDIADTRN